MDRLRSLLNGEIPLAEAARSTPGLVLDIATALLNRPSMGSPAFLSWSVTDQCQCRCRHCANQNIPGDLTPDQRLAIADTIAASGVRWVSLVGGEPLLVPEIADVVRVLKDRGKKVTVTTNGEHLDRVARDFIRLGLDAIHVSVDSHDGAVHDDLRGVPGLFRRVESNLARIRRDRTANRPAIKVRCTISKVNYHHLEAFVDHWKDRVDHIHFQPVVDNEMNHVREDAVMFGAGDEEDFRAAIKGLQARHPEFRNRYYDLMTDYVFHTDDLRRRLRFSCLLMSSTALSVFPDGRVSSCYGTMDTLVGNLLEESVEALWRSRKMVDLRRRIREADPSCFCWDPNTPYNLHLLRLARILGL